MSLGAKGLFALTLLISSSLCPPPSTKVIARFQFDWESKAPGNLIAFRLAPGATSGSICFQGQCFKATHGWSLFATKLSAEGNLGILLSDGHSRWVVRSFTLDDSLFLRLNTHLSRIRLPANVVTKIKQGAELISNDHLKDQELFKINSQRPWSTHWRVPLKATVTSPFGSTRVVTRGTPYVHYGMDLRAALRTPVRACSDGIVIDASFDPIYGNVATVDHGKGLLSRYMHLSEFKTSIGEDVKAGELLGFSGTTGRSEAPHLHWEMRYRGQPIDPLETTRLMERLAYLE